MEKKILLIEDDLFIREMYESELKRAGYKITACSLGEDGIKALQKDRFDLVLLDIMLPGMNGLEMLKKWREKAPKNDMPVLLLTNLGQDAVIKEGFSLGAQGYLIKASYTPDQVVTEVKNALTGKQVGSPSPKR